MEKFGELAKKSITGGDSPTNGTYATRGMGGMFWFPAGSMSSAELKTRATAALFGMAMPEVIDGPFSAEKTFSDRR